MTHDPYLNEMNAIALSNERNGASEGPTLSITAVVNGLMVSGELASVERWEAQFGEHTHDDGTTLPQSLEKIRDQAGIATDDGEYLHLVNAIAVAGLAPTRVEQLRVRLDRVDAWSFGALVPPSGSH